MPACVGRAPHLAVYLVLSLVLSALTGPTTARAQQQPGTITGLYYPGSPVLNCPGTFTDWAVTGSATDGADFTVTATSPSNDPPPCVHVIRITVAAKYYTVPGQPSHCTDTSAAAYYQVLGDPTWYSYGRSNFGAPSCVINQTWYFAALDYSAITTWNLTEFTTLNPADVGVCDAGCRGVAGAPINVASGNAWIQERDYSLPGLGGGLELVRTWNSHWQDVFTASAYGMFGQSWMSTYEESLTFIPGQTLYYQRSDGSIWTFNDNGDGTFTLASPLNEHATLFLNPITAQYVMTMADGTQKIFQQNGKLAALVDRNGNTVTLAYDSSGNLLTQLNDATPAPNTRSITFNYNNPQTCWYPTSPTPCAVTSVQDWTSAVIATYSYNTNGTLSQVLYPDGSALNFTYDSNYPTMIARVTDANGKTLEAHTYDGAHNALTSVRGNGADPVTLTYGAGQTTLTGALGSTTYGYEAHGGRNFVNSVGGPGCSSCGGRGNQTLTYDANGNVSTITDGLNPPNTTAFTYDANGNVTSKITSPDGGTTTYKWTYTYNQFGEVLTAVDPFGNSPGHSPGPHRTTNTYDSKGNLLTTTLPSAGTVGTVTTTFGYDAYGELTSVTDPLGNPTTIHYNSVGLLDYVMDAQQNKTSFGYDGRGNRTSVTDALGTPTAFVYDVMNRLTDICQGAASCPGSAHTRFGYDSRGRRISVQDADDNSTQYGYDDADRLTSVADALNPNSPTTYGYDTENNLKSISPEGGPATQFDYTMGTDNPLGQLKSVTFPSGLSEVYTYDAVGNLLTKKDRKGNTITYNYDGVYRLTSKSYPDSTSVAYVYDALNRVTQVVDPTGGIYTFSYDAISRLLGSTAYYVFLPSKIFSVGYTYDKASNRQRLAPPWGQFIDYSYDSLNRLSSLTDVNDDYYGFSYDALSRRTQLARPNGVATNYQYDALSRLTSVLHQKNSATLDGATYNYDAVGNRTSKTNSLNSVTSGYTYDPVYELLNAIQSGAPPTTTESYTFDPVGNRLTSLAGSYSNNSSNEMTASPGATYTYDANGNTLTKAADSAVTNYTWDFENRLTSVTLPNGGGTVSFKYDPFGRRIEKVSPSGTTIYAYDGDNVVVEEDAAGTAIGRFTQGLGVDEPLAIFVSHDLSTYFYQADGLGSVTSLSGSTGALANTYVYDSFGNLTSSTGSVPNSFQFTAREFDSETGLYYYRARYYDPTVGRFLSEDPIGFGGGQTDLYAYLGNEPVDYTDPLGLRKLTDCEKQRLAPYIPKIDLDKADLHDGQVPWYLGQDYGGITRGNDIYFRPGVYDPSTINGLGVLGHELVHVGQYRNGLTWLKYLLASRHGYEKNPYEIPAFQKEEEIKAGLTKEKCSGCPRP